ncbi:hypothetical protein CKAN_00842700 [Cinnamomum micranthum f. kanehirae]|uniref:Uncharacterized protein n=1 Tax=Cinnamomum micranthum f. kanehirae TaxID=337451 RepID=A0A3S3Q5R1_9MAGN|nr:hypothetical protein CKAN_00842700 [Cinnamomum micranthum f. kanehirae]
MTEYLLLVYSGRGHNRGVYSGTTKERLYPFRRGVFWKVSSPTFYNLQCHGCHVDISIVFFLPSSPFPKHHLCGLGLWANWK